MTTGKTLDGTPYAVNPRVRCKAALSVLVTFFAVAVARAEYLFWAKPDDDATLSWDIPGAWKQVYSPWDFVRRLPTNEDILYLNSAATALAGDGIAEPHSLRITNGAAAARMSSPSSRAMAPRAERP